MDSISLPISEEPISGFSRVAKHENFVIGPDLNMTQEIRVVTLNREGKPILDNLAELSPEQRRAAEFRYRDQTTNRTTAGAFVDKTGMPVAADAEGAIAQRDFFQSITLGDLKKAGLSITDKTPVVSLVYALIGQEIGKLDKRAIL